MTRAGTVHVIKDITEAKASEERYTSLFNHMHEGVFASTPNGKLVDCNEAFVRMLGYSNKEEVWDWTCFSLFTWTTKTARNFSAR